MGVRTLGEYSVTRLLGRGGMGEVWEGFDPDLDRHVAIKVILPQLSTDPTFRERLHAEAKLIAAMRHQNIVQLYDFDMVDGQAVMVMEFLEGGSLRERLTRLRDAGQPLPLATIAALLDAVAAGLDYAHARGAVHRDLKPGNILFSVDNYPVISDFGIAKIVSASSSLKAPILSEPGSILGTPAYMSPEQAEGGDLDHRSDIYSLGIILYELATGRVPFTGNSPAEILTQQIQHEPPAPRTFNPTLPASVEAVLMQALAKDPAARFASAMEMAQSLRTAAHLEGMAGDRSPFPNVEGHSPVASSGNSDMASARTLTDGAMAASAQESPTIAVQQDHKTIVKQKKDDARPSGAVSE